MRWGTLAEVVQACLTGYCLCRRFYLEIIGRRRFRVLSSFEQVCGRHVQGCAAIALPCYWQIDCLPDLGQAGPGGRGTYEKASWLRSLALLLPHRASAQGQLGRDASQSPLWLEVLRSNASVAQAMFFCPLH